jgi:predicted nucleic acid-binding protein
MVSLDASVLLLLFDPDADAPIDDATGEPVTRCKERIELLLKTLSDGGVRVLVPTPALSEVLVSLGSKKSEILQAMLSSYAFKIQAFEERAAIEVAFLTDDDLQSGKVLTPTETKAKVKYDRQIIAISKVNQVTTIYSDDEKLRNKAIANGMQAVGIADLPLPPEPPQMKMKFPEPDNEPEQA